MCPGEANSRELAVYTDSAAAAKKYGRVFSLFAEARDFKVSSVSLVDSDVVPFGQNGVAILILDGEEMPKALEFISNCPGEFPFAVLGTPNCKYGEEVHVALTKSGAQALLPYFLISELPVSFTDWMNDLWEALERGSLPSRFPLRYRVEARDEVTPTAKPKNFHASRVVENKLLTSPDYPRPSHLLTLDIAGSGLKYNTGDHVVILPVNEDSMVKRALAALRVSGDQIVEVLGRDGAKVHLYASRGVDLRTLLKYYVNLQGLATRKFLATLSLLATDAKEAAELAELATNMTKDSPYSEVIKGVFSYVDALEKYTSVSLNLDQALSVLPPIQPRKYSASCSPIRDPDQVQLVFTVVSYPTSTGGVFRGAATTYMSQLKAGDVVHMTLEKGFKEVKIDGDNIKYVGVALGSGVAMLRGISQHFHCLRTMQNKSSGQVLLYYGVRHQNKDFLFADEFEKYAETGALILKTAFSHDQEEFITPGHRMREDPETLCRYLVDDPDCIFLYCGPAGPAYSSIVSAITDAIKDARPTINPEDHMRKMKEAGRWEAQAYTPGSDHENPFKY